MMNRIVILLTLLVAASIVPALLLTLGHSRAVQTPKMALTWNLPGDHYCDQATTTGDGLTPCPAGETANQMNVGPIVSTLTTACPGNDLAHLHQADLVAQTVEDLVGWQGRFNYDGGKMRVSNANFLPYTDSVPIQTLSFNNLPLDAGTHRALTTATSIPPAAPGPQSALIGSSYLGTQTFPISPDTPAKSPADDTSYTAPTGGVLARVILQVLASNANTTMNMDLGTSPFPGSNVVVFNGVGTTTVTLTAADLSGVIHNEGLNCPTTTPTPTPTVAPTPTPTVTAAPTLLNITKVADANPALAGLGIGFSITVSIVGPGAATGVTVSDRLPHGSGLNWSITPAACIDFQVGTFCDPSNPLTGSGGFRPPANACSIGGSPPKQILNCSFGDMSVGQGVTVHVSSPAALASCRHRHPNTAAARATNSPQVTASASITVQCCQLSLTKTADAATVGAGSSIGFSMNITNACLTSTTVALTDTLPNPNGAGSGIYWSMASVTGSGGFSPFVDGCFIDGNAMTCLFSNLARGQGVTVHVTSPTTLQSCATYPNTATVGSLSAQASTTVLCPR